MSKVTHHWCIMSEVTLICKYAMHVQRAMFRGHIPRNDLVLSQQYWDESMFMVRLS